MVVAHRSHTGQTYLGNDSLGQYRMIITLDDSFGISISFIPLGLRSGLGVLWYCLVLLSVVSC